MSRYVNADKLWEEIESEDIYTGFESACIFKMVREKIKNAPTANVEKVTRCKDCAFCVGLFTCKKNEDQIWRCQRFGLNMINFDGYCSWAQRYNGLDKETEE